MNPICIFLCAVLMATAVANMDEFDRDCSPFGEVKEQRGTSKIGSFKPDEPYNIEANDHLLGLCFATRETGCAPEDKAEAFLEYFVLKQSSNEVGPSSSQWVLNASFPLTKIFQSSIFGFGAVFRENGIVTLRYRKNGEPEGEICPGTYDAVAALLHTPDAEQKEATILMVKPSVIKMDEEIEFTVLGSPHAEIEVYDTNCRGNVLARIPQGEIKKILLKPTSTPLPFHALCYKTLPDKYESFSFNAYIPLGPEEFVVQKIENEKHRGGYTEFKIYGPASLEGSTLYFSPTLCQHGSVSGSTNGTIKKKINPDGSFSLFTELFLQKEEQMFRSVPCVTPAGVHSWKGGLMLDMLPPPVQELAVCCRRTSSCPQHESSSNASGIKNFSSASVVGVSIVVLLLIGAGAAAGYFFMKRNRQSDDMTQPMTDLDVYTELDAVQEVSNTEYRPVDV